MPSEAEWLGTSYITCPDLISLLWKVRLGPFHTAAVRGEWENTKSWARCLQFGKHSINVDVAGVKHILLSATSITSFALLNSSISISSQDLETSQFSVVHFPWLYVVVPAGCRGWGWPSSISAGICWVILPSLLLYGFWSYVHPCHCCDLLPSWEDVPPLPHISGLLETSPLRGLLSLASYRSPCKSVCPFWPDTPLSSALPPCQSFVSSVGTKYIGIFNFGIPLTYLLGRGVGGSRLKALHPDPEMSKWSSWFLQMLFTPRDYRSNLRKAGSLGLAQHVFSRQIRGPRSSAHKYLFSAFAFASFPRGNGRHMAELLKR